MVDRISKSEAQKQYAAADKRVKNISTIAQVTSNRAKVLDKRAKAIELQERYGTSRGNKQAITSVDRALRSLSKTTEALTHGVKNITVETARGVKNITTSGAEAVKQYSQAVGEDINVNKQNLVVTTLGKTTPLIGYAIAKMMETTVFKNMIARMKESIGKALDSVAAKFKRLASAGWDKSKEFLSSIVDSFSGKRGAAKLKMAKARAAKEDKRKKRYHTQEDAIKAALGDAKVAKTIREKAKNKSIEKSVPHMAKGGLVTKEGLAKVHAAEIVQPVDKVVQTIIDQVNKRLERKEEKDKKSFLEGTIFEKAKEKDFFGFNKIGESITNAFQIMQRRNLALEQRVMKRDDKNRKGLIGSFMRAYSEEAKQEELPLMERQVRAILELKNTISGQQKVAQAAWEKMLYEHPFFHGLTIGVKALNKTFTSPLKFLFRKRGTYAGQLSNKGTVFERLVDTGTQTFTGTMEKLDAIVNNTYAIARGVNVGAGSLVAAPRQKGWSIAGKIYRGARKGLELAGKGVEWGLKKTGLKDKMGPKAWESLTKKRSFKDELKKMPGRMQGLREALNDIIGDLSGGVLNQNMSEILKNQRDMMSRDPFIREIAQMRVAQRDEFYRNKREENKRKWHDIKWGKIEGAPKMKHKNLKDVPKTQQMNMFGEPEHPKAQTKYERLNQGINDRVSRLKERASKPVLEFRDNINKKVDTLIEKLEATKKSSQKTTELTKKSEKTQSKVYYVNKHLRRTSSKSLFEQRAGLKQQKITNKRLKKLDNRWWQLLMFGLGFVKDVGLGLGKSILGGITQLGTTIVGTLLGGAFMGKLVSKFKGLKDVAKGVLTGGKAAKAAKGATTGAKAASAAGKGMLSFKLFDKMKDLFSAGKGVAGKAGTVAKDLAFKIPGLKTIAGKGAALAGKTGLKSLVKKVPLIGALASIGFALKRFKDGDYTGAAMEVASGVAGSFPGIGTGISLAIDAGIVGRDFVKGKKDKAQSTAEFGLKTLAKKVPGVAAIGTSLYGAQQLTKGKEFTPDSNRMAKWRQAEAAADPYKNISMVNEERLRSAQVAFATAAMIIGPMTGSTALMLASTYFAKKSGEHPDALLSAADKITGVSKKAWIAAGGDEAVYKGAQIFKSNYKAIKAKFIAPDLDKVKKTTTETYKRSKGVLATLWDKITGKSKSGKTKTQAEKDIDMLIERGQSAYSASKEKALAAKKDVDKILKQASGMMLAATTSAETYKTMSRSDKKLVDRGRSNLDSITKRANEAKTRIVDFREKASEKAEPFIDKAKQKFNDLKTNLPTMISTLGENISTSFTKMTNFFKDAYGDPVKFYNNMKEKVFQGITKVRNHLSSLYTKIHDIYEMLRYEFEYRYHEKAGRAVSYQTPMPEATTSKLVAHAGAAMKFKKDASVLLHGREDEILFALPPKEQVFENNRMPSLSPKQLAMLGVTKDLMNAQMTGEMIENMKGIRDSVDNGSKSSAAMMTSVIDNSTRILQQSSNVANQGSNDRSFRRRDRAIDDILYANIS